MTRTMKNGKIEFTRFAFSVIILLFHLGEVLISKNYRIAEHFTFFSNGWIGVEFFFAVSGYLMASSAFKNRDNKASLGKDTFLFMEKKLMAVLPYHLIVFSITFLTLVVAKYESLTQTADYILSVIPNFLLIQRSGLKNSDVLGVEWYISEMLIAMLVLYPICKKYYDKFAKIIAPVTSLLIIGYLIKTTGSLNGSTNWSVIVSKTFLRAVSEICAGVFCFELCRNIKKLNFTKKDKLILTFFEIICYLVILAFIVTDIPKKFSGTIFIFICCAVCLSFSDITYGKKLFNNKFVYFLGTLSLPIYLCHSLTRRVIVEYFSDLRFRYALIIFILLTAAFTAFVIPLEKALRKAIMKKRSQLTNN